MPWFMFKHDWHHSGLAGCFVPTGANLTRTHSFGVDLYSSPVYWAPQGGAGGPGMYIVNSIDGKVYAYNDSTGLQMWNYSMGSGSKASPLIDNNTHIIYVPTGGNVKLLNRTTGALICTYSSGSNIRSSLAKIPGVDRVYFGADDGYTYAINVSCQQVWRKLIDGPLVASPSVYDNNRMFIGGPNGVMYGLNPSNGGTLWTRSLGDGPINASLTASADGNQVFVATVGGNLWSLSALNGATQWSRPLYAASVSGPSVKDNTVVVGTNGGNVRAFNRPNGSPLWTYSTGSPVKGSPAIDTDGRMAVGADNGVLYVLNLTNGNLLWSYDTGAGALQSSPAVDNEHIFIGNSTHFMVFG